ncbi:MAG: CoA-binding protein, partial [Ilumatobacteraceae bacterium]
CDYEHVWFVNPKGGEILGQPVYRSLAELPDAPDLVDVFRRAEDLPSVAAEAAAIPGTKVFWAQLGLWSDEAAEIAETAGLRAVMNRCLKIEHARFAGGLHLAGFDTGVISSRRSVDL